MKNKNAGFVYIISAVKTDYFKIGITRESVVRRLKELQTSSPNKLRYVFHVYVKDMYKIERHLHKTFSSFHCRGEWFSLTTEDVQKCIQMMRLTEIPKIKKKVEKPILARKIVTINDNTDVSWTVDLLKDYYPYLSPEQLFLSVAELAVLGKTTRDIIRTVLKLTGGQNDPVKSYTNHGKTLLKWLIINYDSTNEVLNLPEIQKLFNN